MNHCEPPRLRARPTRAFHCLSLLLLPAAALHDACASISVRLNFPTAIETGKANSLPYLRAVGSSPLRFEEPPPSRDQLLSSTIATTTASSAAAAASADSAAATLIAARLAAQASRESEEAPVPDATTDPIKPMPLQGKTPEPILPDDARPHVLPEEFLPYFRAPGSGKKNPDVTLLVPAPRSVPSPAPLPPSSATYTQSK